MVNNDSPACEKKYMRTDTDYNSCVYDLKGDYDTIPANQKLPSTEDINTILSETIGAAKKGFFKLKTDKITPNNILTLKYNFEVNNIKMDDTIKPENLSNTEKGVINNDGNLVCSGTDTFYAVTPLIKFRGENSVQKIVFKGGTKVYTKMFGVSYNNEFLLGGYAQKDFTNMFQTSLAKTDYVYFVFEITPATFFTSLEIYIKNKLRVNLIE